MHATAAFVDLGVVLSGGCCISLDCCIFAPTVLATSRHGLPRACTGEQIRTGYYIHRRCNNILCSFHSRPPDTYNAIPNYKHDFLKLQMSDATEEGTFLAAAQPFEDIIAYVGAVPLYRFGKKQELIDALLLHALLLHALLLHMAYTRKRTARTQYVHELI